MSSKGVPAKRSLPAKEGEYPPVVVVAALGSGKLNDYG